MSIDSIIRENKKRLEVLNAPYDPISGLGSTIERQKVSFTDIEDLYIPIELLNTVDWIDNLCNTGNLSDFSNSIGMDPGELMRTFFIERYKADFEFWAFTTIVIQDKLSLKDIPFKLRLAQRILLKVLEEMRLSGIPIRVVLLKARQWGGSTLVQMYMMWLQQIHKKNWHLAVCAQDDGAAKNISEMYNRAALNYPKEIAKIKLRPYARSPKNLIDANRGGIIGVGSINNPDQFRSYNYPMNHICIAPKTPIIINNGFVVNVDELKIGDQIITHNGNISKVKLITKSKPGIVNGNGKSIIIKGWLSNPIETTPNHPIWTDKGWIRADELTMAHYILMPIRKITDEIKEIQLPKTPKRKQNGGRISKGSGEKIKLTKEIGFGFGYYLAEGSVHINFKTGNYKELQFARHDNEVEYGDRVVNAFKDYISSHYRFKRKDTFTTVENLYSSVLAKYIFETMGSKENKVIPDWFFNCGKEFLEGVLQGYLSGDGSKTNGKQDCHILASISATTISSSIATQIRDIAASLGYGWAAIDIRKAGNYYDRNCKKTHTVRWNGLSARKLRGLVGLPPSNNGRTVIEKTFEKDGFIWIKIKEIKESTLKYVYDVEVEHKDHSFRTISFPVKNSESGIWEDTPKRTAKGLVSSLRSSVPNVPYSLIVNESTAKGVGTFFHDEWLAAVNGESRYRAVFIPWFMIDMYLEDIEDYSNFINTMSDYDKFCWDKGASLEGINWYNNYKDGENYDDNQMNEEYPTTPEEAFISTGQRVFPYTYINQARENTRDPITIGDIQPAGIMNKEAFKDIKFHENKNLKYGLKIWKFPEPFVKIKGKKYHVTNRYCGFADIGGLHRDADYSCINIVDRYWMMFGGNPETAAVWHGHLDQDLFSWKCAQLGYWYNKMLLAIEVNSLRKEKTDGDYFITVLDNIAPDYDNLFIRNSHESINTNYIPKYGFHTGHGNKEMIITNLLGGFRDGTITEREKEAFDECDTFERKPDGSMGAVTGKKDDRVVIKAGSFWLATKYMDMPQLIEYVEPGKRSKTTSKKIISEASM